MRDHRKLRAFELADDIVLLVYKLSSQFPKEEMYGLTSQMRRSALSVVSNIVEGCARNTKKEYLHFLHISFGSLKELNYQFGLSLRLGYLKNEEDYSNCQTKLIETEKVLASLIRSLNNPKPYP
ncbi:MAG: four helix bundle protein [Bacteroidales bacterium]